MFETDRAAFGRSYFLHGTTYKLPWLVVTVAVALNVMGDLVWDGYWVLFELDAPNPSLADPLYLVGWALVIAAFLIWSRRVNAEHDREAGVDAAIVSLARAGSRVQHRQLRERAAQRRTAIERHNTSPRTAMIARVTGCAVCSRPARA